MRNKILLIFAALILAVVPLAAACAPPEEVAPPPVEPIKLTFAFFAPAHSFPGMSMQRWVDEVEKRTNGKVIIETFPGGTLLTAPATFDGVLAGVADIATGATSYEPGRFPLLVGLERPGIGFPNGTVSARVLWELYQEFRPASLADFKVLHMFTAGLHHIATIDPVRSLEDLKGLELRGTGGVLPILNALGAAPIALSMADLPGNLEKGVVKGYSSSYDVLKDFRLAELVNYGVDYSYAIGATFATVMNKDTWNALPPDVQKVMDDLVLEQTVWTGEYVDEYDAMALEWAIAEHGFEVITLSPAERARWEEALKPVLGEWLEDMAAKGLPGQEFLDRAYELIAKYSK